MVALKDCVLQLLPAISQMPGFPTEGLDHIEKAGTTAGNMVTTICVDEVDGMYTSYS